MKIIHNNEQFSSDNYNDLANKPTINSKELVGDVTGEDLDLLPLSGGTMTGTITFSSGKKDTDYLPLSGGTMAGVITSSNSETICKSNDKGMLLLRGGTWGDITAPVLSLNSKSSSIKPGSFTLGARNTYYTCDLIGKPDGTLTWCNYNVTRGLKLNGSDNPSPSFYAPTAAGTSGNVLISTGAEPEWKTATRLYRHNITYKNTLHSRNIAFNFINTDSSAYTTDREVYTAVYNLGFIDENHLLTASSDKSIVGVFSGLNGRGESIFFVYDNYSTISFATDDGLSIVDVVVPEGYSW